MYSFILSILDDDWQTVATASSWATAGSAKIDQESISRIENGIGIDKISSISLTQVFLHTVFTIQMPPSWCSITYIWQTDLVLQ